MIEESWIDKIDAQVAQSTGQKMTPAQRAVIGQMWAEWEDRHPVLLERDPKTGTPHLLIVEESYSGPWSSSSSSFVRKSSCSLFLLHYAWAENGQLRRNRVRTNFAECAQRLDSEKTAQPDYDPGSIDFDESLSVGNLETYVRGLAASMDAYILTFAHIHVESELQPTLAQKLRQEIAPLIKDFIALSSPDIHELLTQTGTRETRTIEWLNDNSDLQKRTYRRQATQAFPLFARMFIPAVILG